MVMSLENKQKARERMLAMHQAKKASKQPIKLNQAGADAGIMQPSGEPAPRIRPIPMLTDEQAEEDLDELGVDDWIKKHYDKGDMNIDGMARILREEREDIYNRLHFLGYPLPEGTYSVNS